MFYILHVANYNDCRITLFLKGNILFGIYDGYLLDTLYTLVKAGFVRYANVWDNFGRKRWSRRPTR